MRSYHWLYFYVFFGVIKPKRKSGQRSILPFLSRFIKMKKKRKSRGFYGHILLCSSPSSHLQTWNMFRVYVKWVGYPLPLSHVIFMSPYTLPFGYSSSHPWRMMFISLSQCCQVILSDVPKSLKIVFLELTNYTVLCTIYPCVSLSISTLISKSSTLVSYLLMKDTLMPSFHRFHPVDFNTLSGIEI